MQPHVSAQLRAVSHELELVCDARGRLTWADERAVAKLACEPGEPLTRYAAPGAESAVRELLEVAAGGRFQRFEVTLLVDGRPATVTFSGLPYEGQLLLVGSLDAREDLLSHVRSAMSEAGDLRRRMDLRKEDLARLQVELAESYAAIVSLYRELDEKNDALRRATYVRARIVSNVSHDFRTPVNAVIGLSRLLLGQTAAPLDAEQEKQVQFIHRSATELARMVDDLLDVSQLDHADLRLHVARFTGADLIASLRGMVRALPANPAVQVTFDPAPEGLWLETDEGKLAQIVRQLITNALKFTSRGEVRVSVAALGDGRVEVAVRDTGIGIAPADQARVFEEFALLEGVSHPRSRGSGLGLATARRLAESLGGTIALESEPGVGSTFRVVIPGLHPDAAEMYDVVRRSEAADPDVAPILVVEDDRRTLFLYERYLQDSGFRVVPARSVAEARQVLEKLRPSAIVLDVMLENETSWAFLSELKGSPGTRGIPVLVVTITDRESKARALGADEFWMKPLDRDWLLSKLETMTRRSASAKILVIEDDEVSRYLIRRMLADSMFRVIEASTGLEGLRLAEVEQPSAILLDFILPGMSAFEVIDELKASPRTRTIPVIVHTAKRLDGDELRRLSEQTAAILDKHSVTRELALGRIRDALAQAGVRETGPRERGAR